MASDVDICNLALAHLGDSATVASIDPPEGSAQASHCARFYPIARDSLLTMPEAQWGFATHRIAPAMLNPETDAWQHCYALPDNFLRAIAVTDAEAVDDYNMPSRTESEMPMLSGSLYVPQPYVIESLSDGTQCIYTNQENAALRYVRRVTDSNKFSQLFLLTLSWHLASMLAGPLLKGDTGIAESKRCIAVMQGFLSKAAVADANQRKAQPQHVVGWIAGR